MTETKALARVRAWLGIEIRGKVITVYQPVGLKLLGILDYLQNREGYTVTYQTPRIERVPVWSI